jgi:hypothetical protein
MWIAPTRLYSLEDPNYPEWVDFFRSMPTTAVADIRTSNDIVYYSDNRAKIFPVDLLDFGSMKDVLPTITFDGDVIQFEASQNRLFFAYDNLIEVRDASDRKSFKKIATITF